MPVIEFSRTHSYLPVDEGISLPVFLNSGTERVKLLAHLDTGASHCLFERRHGELLNLEVEAGDPIAFRTATGRVEAFGHLVTIETLGLSFESVVYFFADKRINRNLLGRLGWLNRIRLGLIDHDGGALFSVLRLNIHTATLGPAAPARSRLIAVRPIKGRKRRLRLLLIVFLSSEKATRHMIRTPSL